MFYQEAGARLYCVPLLTVVSIRHCEARTNVTNKYKRLRHHFDASNELAIEQKFQYDHAGRLKSTSESVNKKTPVITSQLAYDDLGQLQSKKLHATSSGQLQKTDYAYNIRGWLTGINPTFNTEENDLFGLNLYYTDTTAFAALKGTPQYNGNIRAMKWRHKNDVETGYAFQGYGFEYDKLNRLISGKHGITNTAGIFPAEYLNRYNEDNLKYDNNGNILNLSRTGGYKDVDYLLFGQMDSLKYKYMPNSNQLMSISDNASVEGYGYNDVNKDTTDFVYDGNGNLTQYKDKKIKSIEYNFLNLPKKIIFDNADSIVYIYDAVGIKHIMKFFEKGKQKNAEYYVGGIVYETDSTDVTAEKLRFVMNAEGRLVRLKNGSFRNEYFLKDHLGNTRVVFADTLGNGTLAVIQETNYYPFGLAFTGVDLRTEKNKFLYNGKELQVDGDLGMYDYGARMYDPQIGRFHTIDTYSEKYYELNPYQYVANSPINSIDINGDSIWVVFKDANGKVLNYLPDEVQKLFNEEFGISVIYNAETQMMGFGEDVDSDLSQSNTATGILKKALQDDNSAEKGFMKHGKIVFGYNLRDEVTGQSVNEGSWTAGIAHVDLGDYDKNTGKSRFFDYNGVTTRSHNVARALEEEYLGHNYLNSASDGGSFTLSKVNKQANLYIRERGLPERLNYGYGIDYIFFGNPNNVSKTMMKQMVKGTLTPTMDLKRKK